MKISRNLIRNQKGFNLIEVIIIIIVSSIAFAMIFPYFGTFITDSSAPIHRLNNALELQQTAERITAYYKYNPEEEEEEEEEEDNLLIKLQKSLINNPTAYGQNFSVEYNGFVKFVNKNDTAISNGDHENLLKIKIRHLITKETITLLFATQ